MAMILFNPTNEHMTTQYVGETVEIGPGSKVRVDDPRGRHVLNTLGPRGLMTLEYGDEGAGEDKKRAEGLERNKNFKRKQVLDFNTMNEQRFQARLPYLTPTKQVQGYAKELGIGLRQPYNVEDSAAKEMADLQKRLDDKTQEAETQKSEVNELKAQVSELTGLMNKFIAKAGDAAADISEKDEVTQPDGVTVDIRKFSRANMVDWLLSNWNLYQDYPEKQQAKIEKRYETLFGETMPATKDDLEKVALKTAA